MFGFKSIKIIVYRFISIPNKVSKFVIYNDCLDSYINDSAWRSYGVEKYEGFERPTFPVTGVEASIIIPSMMIITLLVTITVVDLEKIEGL